MNTNTPFCTTRSSQTTISPNLQHVSSTISLPKSLSMRNKITPPPHFNVTFFGRSARPICSATQSQAQSQAQPVSPTTTQPASTTDTPPPPPPSPTHLQRLDIQNFALVDSQAITLRPGFNVITGESGSGKSVLIEALNQVLGAPAADDAVRPPSTSATIEGTFVINPGDQPALRTLLLSLGLPPRSLSKGLDTLIIRRELHLSPTGSTRSRCTLNGVSTSLRILREVGRALVDVNGQHAALSMRDGTAQLELVDTVAGLRGAVGTLERAWKELKAAKQALRAVDALANEEDRAILQQLVDDVAAVGVDAGEDVELRRRLRQLETRRDGAERCGLITVGIGSGGGGGSGGMMDALHDVQIHVRTVLAQEERLATTENEEEEEEEEDQEQEENASAVLLEAMEALDAARTSLDAAQSLVERYSRQYRFSQAEYTEVSERLQEIQRLLKQHDVGSADELLEAAERASASLDAFYQMEGRRDELEADLKGKEDAVVALAVEISVARREAGQRLRAAVLSVLGELAMHDAAFDVKLSWKSLDASDEGKQGGIVIGDAAAAARCDHPPGAYRMHAEGGSAGLDSVEFLFAAGPEEPMRSLAGVASGGEAARVMLSIKAAPAFLSSTSGSPANSSSLPSSFNGAPALSSPIVVLDEIDSSIGSRLGQSIGRILRTMATPSGSTLHPPSSSSSSSAQVLCVSHLPAVAAHAQHHVCVRKSTDSEGRVVSTFEVLDSEDDRLQEVAAMLGLPQAAAEELMAQAAGGSGSGGDGGEMNRNN